MAFVSFKQKRHALNLVADFSVAGKVRRFDPALADRASRLEFGAVVLFFFAAVHQAGGFENDLPPQFLVGHCNCAETKPIKAAPGMGT